MSTKKPTTGGKNKPKPNRDSSSEAAKKRKSTGFIETSGYKPNWLETGPLDPSMLPDPLLDDEGPLSADEFDALQQSLQGFYRQQALEQGEEAPAAEPAIADESPAGVSPTAEPPADEPLPDVSLAVTEQFVATAEPPVEELPAPVEEILPEAMLPEAPPVIELAELAEETQPPAAAPEAWLQPLLNGDAEPGPFIAPLAPPMETGAAFAAEDDVFVEPSPEPEAVAVAADDILAAPKPKHQRAARTGPRRRRDRLGIGLFLISLLLLGAAALIYFVNPFSRLALGAASLARPVASPGSASPRVGSGAWCVRGDFQAASAAPIVLGDGGDSGDLLAEDGIFSAEHSVAQPGAYEWQVLDCDDPDLLFPPAPAWVTTTTAGETVTFTFDSHERADPLFFPISYVVSATDAATDFQVMGSFQDWNPADPSGRLEQINVGLYQQVRRIARAGSYEGYVIAGDERQAIDAYGRTTDPIPFAFETDRNGDYVVFLVDTDRGRASVIYDMPPLLSSLSYGRGHLILSLVLAGLSLLLLLGLLVRFLILHNRRLQLESGCPRCGRPELMRIARRSSDRFLHVFGIPAYRYRCRHCTWEGTRLSESGETVSPGIETSRFSSI